MFFDIIGFWRGGEEAEKDIGGCEGGCGLQRSLGPLGGGRSSPGVRSLGSGCVVQISDEPGCEIVEFSV